MQPWRRRQPQCLHRRAAAWDPPWWPCGLFLYSVRVTQPHRWRKRTNAAEKSPTEAGPSSMAETGHRRFARVTFGRRRRRRIASRTLAVEIVAPLPHVNVGHAVERVLILRQALLSAELLAGVDVAGQAESCSAVSAESHQLALRRRNAASSAS